ncbi:hypothetical protein DX873_10405 [Flagellimonas nanhaiensis]|uniref:Alpha/beta hydrolase n=2 Tax=Flagellimonas nanhaiensis TaxID=2292706 RepID=A0A371JQH6_9FLAO|nr:hypothetical protein DX873_10405 [Allomuricauda nanhaiensis]
MSAQQKVMELGTGTNKLLVRITMPDNYSPTKSYPVLLGPGLDGGNLETGCRFFGPNPEKHGWILVESLVHMKSRKMVNVLLNHLEAHYKIKATVILGFSANSVAMFEIASQFRDRIHGVVGMPGNPAIGASEKLKLFAKTKITMIVGERDTYWKKRAQKANKAMDELGIWNNLVIVPKGGHILDEFAGKPLFSVLNKMVYAK